MAVPSSFRFCPAAPEEADELMRVAQRIWRAHYPPIIGAAATERLLAAFYAPEAIAASFASGALWEWMEKNDGERIGYVVTQDDAAGDRLLLARLYLLPEHQGRGIGAAAIARVQARAQSLGRSRVHVTVHRANLRAIAAYRRAGFQVHASVRNRIAGLDLDDLVLAWRCDGVIAPEACRVLLVGGAPRQDVDAVRVLTVPASGSTARRLADLLAARGIVSDLLLNAGGDVAAPLTYRTRAELDAQIAAWIRAHPDGAVVMSAAVNDYAVASVELHRAGQVEVFPPGAKIPSGGDELVIRLRPAAKLIDTLRGLGLRGPIIGFKFEASDTVIASARALCHRVGAAVVVANSLSGDVQALVDARGETRCADRESLLIALADRIASESSVRAPI